MDNFKYIFDPRTKIYLDIIDKIIGEVKSISYDYLYIEEYSAQLEKDITEGHRIYWTEIISNAHNASLMSMYRHRLWVSGIVDSYNNKNYLTFSANLRGLLESVSDSHYSLGRIPRFLEKFSTQFENAIKKLGEYHPSSTKDFIFIACSDLEEDLLHFAYARKLSKNNTEPNYHNAQANTNYINTLGNPKFLDLYADLCQITHPAMPSVMDYFDISERPTGYTNTINFLSNKNPDLIKKLIDTYQNELNTLLNIGFNYPIQILKGINKLNFDPLYIKIIDEITYEN
jgi:hypothetical protein